MFGHWLVSMNISSSCFGYWLVFIHMFSSWVGYWLVSIHTPCCVGYWLVYIDMLYWLMISFYSYVKFLCWLLTCCVSYWLVSTHAMFLCWGPFFHLQHLTVWSFKVFQKIYQRYTTSKLQLYLIWWPATGYFLSIKPAMIKNMTTTSTLKWHFCYFKIQT